MYPIQHTCNRHPPSGGCWNSALRVSARVFRVVVTSGNSHISISHGTMGETQLGSISARDGAVSRPMESYFCTMKPAVLGGNEAENY